MYRLLKDLNNAAPTNPLVTDFKKARVAEERKKAFQEEFAPRSMTLGLNFIARGRRGRGMIQTPMGVRCG